MNEYSGSVPEMGDRPMVVLVLGVHVVRRDIWKSVLEKMQKCRLPARAAS